MESNGLIVAMTGWFISVILVFTGVYLLIFKWGRSKGEDHSSKKSN